jgi:hypothetical protein
MDWNNSLINLLPCSSVCMQRVKILVNYGPYIGRSKRLYVKLEKNFADFIRSNS